MNTAVKVGIVLLSPVFLVLGLAVVLIQVLNSEVAS